MTGGGIVRHSPTIIWHSDTGLHLSKTTNCGHTKSAYTQLDCATWNAYSFDNKRQNEPRGNDNTAYSRCSLSRRPSYGDKHYSNAHNGCYNCEVKNSSAGSSMGQYPRNDRKIVCYDDYDDGACSGYGGEDCDACWNDAWTVSFYVLLPGFLKADLPQEWVA